MYGYKTKLSILSNVLAIFVTETKPGSIAYIEIFKRNICRDDDSAQRCTDEKSFKDIDEMSENIL